MPSLCFEVSFYITCLLSVMYIFTGCLCLMQSRTFSGFSIVRSMHEKGFYEMRLTMEFSAGVKKIKTFLKKALCLFLKSS